MSTVPNAAFIEKCRSFAERELDEWYRHIVTEFDEGKPVDWEGYTSILGTKAVTTEEIRVKALAYVAFDADILSDANPDADPCQRFLSSLLRDIVTDDRDEIVGRLAEKYGPLPPQYTPNGIWLGPEGEVE